MPKLSGADWTSEELIVALHTFQTNIDQELTQSHPAIIKLSELLRKAPVNPSWLRDDSYRPPDGVRSRVGNFRRLSQGDSRNVPNSALKIWAEYHQDFSKLEAKTEKVLASWQIKKSILPVGNLPFVQGKEYKRSYLHDLWGGSRQSGISPSKKQNVVFIFTGESGEQHGYTDKWVEGVFKYVGEGQRGDMTLKVGNLAVLNHVQDSRDLLLFRQTRRGYVSFEGQMVCTGYDTATGTDTDGNHRQIIIFDLVPLSDKQSEELHEAEAVLRHSCDLSELRELALRTSSAKPSSREIAANTYQRSAAVKLYALTRAAGVCEGCGVSAPFMTAQGRPYLEVHHINKLSDGGPDHPGHVIALCPNCHRRAHYADDSIWFNSEISKLVKKIEMSVDSHC